mmetsp:Transcript_69148/g.162687  ORF Transcript_69148/g.162687 Transcript_69148/m.162687 type:complete len:213 (+) Transcript_69148:432-1070(+)
MALQHVQCVQVSSEDCFPVPKSLLCRRDHQDVFFDWILQTLAIPLGLMTVGSRQHVGALTHLRKSITEILFRLSEKLARWTEFSELGGGLTTLFYKLSGHLVHLGELILQLDNHVAHVLELFIIWIETFRCLHLVSVEVLSFFRDRLQHGTKLSLHPRLRCFQGLSMISGRSMRLIPKLWLPRMCGNLCSETKQDDRQAATGKPPGPVGGGR